MLVDVFPSLRKNTTVWASDPNLPLGLSIGLSYTKEHDLSGPCFFRFKGKVTMARLLVFGNEKGGAGKSTLAMHVIVSLLYAGKTVAIIDLDLRQITLRRFFENRDAYAQNAKLALPMPQIVSFEAPDDPEAQVAALHDAFARLDDQVDIIAVDCPGALTPLSRAAHIAADTLVTPLNDSFIDFDLLARIDPESTKVKGPSIYSEMVWDARKARALNGQKAIDWIVARNRLSSLNMHNKRKVGAALTDLSKRIGFRFVAGLSDRVIYRELFPFGLTLLDHEISPKIPSKLSNIAARQEIRDLVTDLNLPQ